MPNFEEIGNPLSDGTNTYTWKHGRQLATSNDGTKTWTYTYTGDGLRTKRTDGTNTYTYVYNGDKLTYMTLGSNKLYFGYDASGAPLQVVYNGTTYYYVTNLQGDVIAILNSSGTAVVQYTYDAWGNPISTTGSMATTLGTHNPLRYRGYVYDQETNLYYLQSRYYNPKTGRFLNADAMTSTGQGTLGNNMLAYCNNNPVFGVDSCGLRPMSSLERFGNNSIPVPKKEDNQRRSNDAAVAAFYGISSSNVIPTIPEGAMLFVENTTSINIGTYASVVRGKTLVMDRDKYCEYYFWGLGAGYGGINGAPLDKSYTKGYVYGVTDISDYSGFFFGGSSNMVSSVQGAAWAPNGVYAEIIEGTNVAASIGGSTTYYFTSQSDWIYGAADFYVVPYIYQNSPLNSDLRI